MKRSEQVLLYLFLALLLTLGSYQLWKFFSVRWEELSEREHQLNLQTTAAEGYLESRGLWNSRADWLRRTQPEMGTPDVVDNELVELARASSIDGVTTDRLKLLDPVTHPNYRQVGISFRATGSLPAVFGWLHELNQPNQFRVIQRLKVTPDKEDPNLVICEVRLLRWYRPE